MISKSKMMRSSLSNSKVRFSLFDSSSVSEVLEDYYQKNDAKAYEQLVCTIRDVHLDDDDVILLLEQTARFVSKLNDSFRLLIESIIELKWAHRNDVVVKNYQKFIVNLVSVHNCYAKHAVDSIVFYFCYADDVGEWETGEPTNEELKKFVNIHSLLHALVQIIPMSKELLIQSLMINYPYFKREAAIHEKYLYNLFWILEYQPEMQLDLLLLIFSKLIILDTHAPLEEIDEQERDNQEDRMKHPIAHTLDVCLDRLLLYITRECHDCETLELSWVKTKSIYQKMITIFDRLILPTLNTHHVQFTMFFLCSFKLTVAEAFINYLWRKVCNPSIPTTIKRSAVVYLASFLCRAAYVPLDIIKATLHQMSDWVHSYISSQDSMDFIFADYRTHAIFYSVCQGIFYIVAFRISDLVNTKSNVRFLQNLNLAKIVTSKLNPLKMCVPIIAHHFACATRNYQLAYCFSIIEHNSRNTLPTIYIDSKGTFTTSVKSVDTYFPFERYLLRRSKSKIMPLYQEYKSIENSTKEMENEEDDFLNEKLSYPNKQISK